MRNVPAKDMEKYSSAVTLSDMEIFVFPELLYALTLANILSPIVWSWREHDWFAKLDKMTPYRRVLRLKQFIVDHFEFNLDLDTWGLTDGRQELKRFEPFMDPAVISASNALFGYEGDKYYFDMDIRRHFGLDQYGGETLPYWKTETVEAMQAFRHREGYQAGAGECVSLSTLYAAALFVVCRIPLRDIYLLATPLHSQNFVDVADGILTNNRRVVTRTMWFNGTELSAKAQRALRNEQVTIVAHHTGYVHVVEPRATMDPEAYQRLRRQLSAFLSTPRVDEELLCNFLRYHSEMQSCFQFEHDFHGHKRYIGAENVFAYEHGGPYRVNRQTRAKLLESIDEYAFFATPIEDRMTISRLEDFLEANKVDLSQPESVHDFIDLMNCPRQRYNELMEKLAAFCHVTPRMPGEDKTFIPSAPILLDPDQSREEMLATLESLRDSNPVADLAFYACRDAARTDWRPFLKAAMERNPVVVEHTRELGESALIERLAALPNESIYDGTRLAQPDEVWNFGRGDGVERCIALASVLRARDPGRSLTLRVEPSRAILESNGPLMEWPSEKGLERRLEL